MAEAVRDLLEAFYNVVYKMLLRLWLCLWGRRMKKNEREKDGSWWLSTQKLLEATHRGMG